MAKENEYRCTCGEIIFMVGKKFPKGHTTIYCQKCGKEHTVENLKEDG